MILRSGSSGNDVLDLQTKLKGLGYTIDTDGKYGSQTADVVKQFQTDYGLDVDGEAGNQTFTKLNELTSNAGATVGSQAEAPKETQQPKQTTIPKYEESDAVKSAYALIESHKQTKPSEFSWEKQGQLDESVDKWLNREDFTYDLSNDPFYQQYKEQYAALGKMAMEDTMGQAAALTGGYGNSYAQTVGQQAYNSYMQQLQDIVPELYGMARQNYNEEGQRMLDEVSLLQNQRQTAYGEHQDKVNDWYNWLSHLASSAQDLSQTDYQRWRDSVSDDQYAAEVDYQRQQDAYSRLTGLVSVGYNPTDAELAAAGMTREQANAIQASLTSSGDGSGDGNVDNGNGEPSVHDQVIARLKEMKAAEPMASDEGNGSLQYENYITNTVMAYLDELVAAEIITENEKSSLYNRYIGGQL